ncbi:MAG: bifunctional metallophosphatase/5'-nucleotidase [Cyanobacteriota bacterium]|nr:bifunctional metallophosphatase/5'-nucleotidase [Cyanobacteriota bacterium]
MNAKLTPQPASKSLGQRCLTTLGLLLAGLAPALTLAACGDNATGVSPGSGGTVFESDPNATLSASPAAFTVQILHAADQEAGVAAIEDAPRFSSVVNGLLPQFANNLLLTSGDVIIPGPFFNATGGEADYVINTAIGFQAGALGNHEFDLGTNTLGGLIGDFVGFPYLSANLDFSTDSALSGLVVGDGQEASTIPNSLAKSTVITVNGETFGIVGITTPELRSISSPGGVGVAPDDWDSSASSSQLSALASIVQPSIDQLTSQGIDKIIVLAHLQQLANEIGLAPLLRDVDVIIAGGSDTLLANPGERIRTEFGKDPSGPYPLLYRTATGTPVAVVNTDREYRYVGRLVASFDANGVLSAIDDLSGPYPTDDQGVAETGNAAPNSEVVAAVDEVEAILIEKDGNIFGSTTEFLNGERQSVRSEETNLGNLTADANLALAQTVDPSTAVSIKNGGGIRASIGAVLPGDDGERVPPLANELTGKEDGEISQLDIENALRFNNALSILTLTASELLEVVEHGVATAAPGATPGRFPQVGGIAFSFDPALPAGDRVISMALIDATGAVIEPIVANGVVVDPGKTYRVVTLGFLADGGDDYPFPNYEATYNRVDLVPEDADTEFDTVGAEQNALAVYLEAIGTFEQPDVPASDDLRIQNLSVRSDTVLP